MQKMSCTSLLIALVVLVALVGCSKNEEDAPLQTTVQTAVPVEVTGYVTPFDENTLATRSWTPPTGYSLYDEDDYTIGIAFTQNGEDPQMGHFFKSSGKWRTSVGDITASTYYLYGYIPNSAGIDYTVTDRVGANDNYSSGAIVTLQNVPAVMPADLCVVIGAKDGTDKETVTGLRSGDFAYTAKAISGSVDGGNYVFLLFDHLYAALRVKMKVHGDYDALRTIKLKSLRMKMQAGETTSTTKTDIVVDLMATSGESPIQTITYTPGGVTITEPLEFWSSATGETLTTEFSTHTGHFMPQDITTLVLTSVYDVYDKNVTTEHPDGNLIRKDCMATNTMLLSDLLTGQTTTRRGCRYTINMTIKPTYLYMLSEPDLDNPTVVVE